MLLGPAGFGDGLALGELTSPDAAALSARGAVLVVPLGATEQHGPHLPLSTDTDLALALAGRLADARDVVVAPAVPYGSSGEHDGFTGTISIGQDAFEALVVQLCRSATASFPRVLLVCGHGGNAEPLTRAVRLLRGEDRDVHAWLPSWDGEPHAGRTETAMMLALRPERVDMGRAEAGDQRDLSETLPLLRAGGVRAVSANGVLGDPTAATTAEGLALLDRLSSDLISAFDHWVSGT